LGCISSVGARSVGGFGGDSGYVKLGRLCKNARVASGTNEVELESASHFASLDIVGSERNGPGRGRDVLLDSCGVSSRVGARVVVDQHYIEICWV